MSRCECSVDANDNSVSSMKSFCLFCSAASMNVGLPFHSGLAQDKVSQEGAHAGRLNSMFGGFFYTQFNQKLLVSVTRVKASTTNGRCSMVRPARRLIVVSCHVHNANASERTEIKLCFKNVATFERRHWRRRRLSQRLSRRRRIRRRRRSVCVE